MQPLTIEAYCLNDSASRYVRLHVPTGEQNICNVPVNLCLYTYLYLYIYIHWDAERFMITSNHVHKCGYFILLPILRPTQMLLLPILRTNILPHSENEHVQYLRQAASLLHNLTTLFIQNLPHWSQHPVLQ